MTGTGTAGERKVTMTTSTTFVAAVSASSDADAIALVAQRLPAGFSLTGRTGIRSERHMLRTVEVANNGGNVNDCWVTLTSYGISPSKELGSVWEAHLG